jgi:hypothetical protein
VLWIVKAEPKNLGASLGVVKILGMSVMLIWSNIVRVVGHRRGRYVCSRMELGSKSKPFVYSNLKPASKRRQDEMRYTSDVAECDMIFYYLLQ